MIQFFEFGENCIINKVFRIPEIYVSRASLGVVN